MPKERKHVLLNLFLRMLLALFSLPLLGFVFTTSASAATHSEVPKQYLALGDSLAFGFQPNGDYADGYAADLFGTLQATQGFGNLVDLGCVGETSSSFIFSKCSFPPHPASQLTMALADLYQNAPSVGLVTLQIGANDVLGAISINRSTSPPSCQIQPSLFNTGLAKLDFNLKYIILPLLHLALRGSSAHLVLVEYYDPFQLVCPSAAPYVQELNGHLTQDAGSYAQTVSIYNSFEDTSTNPFLICGLTWICDQITPDIHPRTLGYQVIASDIYQDVYGG